MDKYNMEYPWSNIRLVNEPSHKILFMDDSHRYYIKQKKPDKKSSHCISFIWSFKHKQD